MAGTQAEDDIRAGCAALMHFSPRTHWCHQGSSTMTSLWAEQRGVAGSGGCGGGLIGMPAGMLNRKISPHSSEHMPIVDDVADCA